MTMAFFENSGKGVLQILQRSVGRYSVLQCVAACCTVLQCVTECCGVVRCVLQGVVQYWPGDGQRLLFGQKR